MRFTIQANVMFRSVAMVRIRHMFRDSFLICMLLQQNQGIDTQYRLPSCLFREGSYMDRENLTSYIRKSNRYFDISFRGGSNCDALPKKLAKLYRMICLVAVIQVT